MRTPHYLKNTNILVLLSSLSLHKVVCKLLCLTSLAILSCHAPAHLSHVANGWAQNSVNTVIFRKHSLYTHQGYQYTAFYNGNSEVILGKRKSGTDQWELENTHYKGNTWDAHNNISLIVDQDGYLHLSWDHHNSKLRYAKSKSPGSLKLTEELAMTGKNEQVVTYPEFYPLQDGLLFAFRSGESGRGDLILNKYDLQSGEWHRLQENLISGEGTRNAYWQITTDGQQTIHISWVWRESADVASNHDLCYARSTDGGATWSRSNGTPYPLPITASTAEIIKQIPQSSELINQTSMTLDKNGRPIVASYWRPQASSVPQYHLTFQTTFGHWETVNLGFRKAPFSLSGIGTKSIPIARPQVVADQQNNVHVIFRDKERGSKVSIASSTLPLCKKWKIRDLLHDELLAWEPTLDPVQWKENESLHLFIQKVTQVDGEGLSNTAPTPISILEWNP